MGYQLKCDSCEEEIISPENTVMNDGKHYVITIKEKKWGFTMWHEENKYLCKRFFKNLSELNKDLIN